MAELKCTITPEQNEGPKFPEEQSPKSIFHVRAYDWCLEGERTVFGAIEGFGSAFNFI